MVYENTKQKFYKNMGYLYFCRMWNKKRTNVNKFKFSYKVHLNVKYIRYSIESF